MSDRRTQQMAANATPVYPLGQWSSPQQYPSDYPPGHFPPSCNPHPSLRQHNAIAQQNTYESMLAQAEALTNYQTMSRTHPYSHDRSSAIAVPHHSGYSNVDAQSIALAHSSGRIHGQPPSQPYPSSRQASMQSHPYVSPQSYHQPTPPHHPPPISMSPPPQYPTQVAFSQQTDASQYPASPQRPFSCDMCALSFNRQHDLKRHRDTHTGEKPFLCNGGCGKTFTRKDALKRHQLVKRCGIEEGA